MGSRGHGTWAQMYEDVHDHPKTTKLAAVLVACGIPEDCAHDVVVAQLHRLACWALRDNAHGRIGHLTPLRFAQIVRWTRAKHLKAFYAGWMDSGFLDHPGTPEASIHDFGEYFWHILRKRVSGDDQAPEPPPGRRPAGGQNGDDPAPGRRPRARASPETGTITPPPPTTPAGGSAPAVGDAVSGTAGALPPAPPGVFASRESSTADQAPQKEVGFRAGLRDGALVELAAHWRAKAPEAVREDPKLDRHLAQVLDAAKDSVELGKAILDAYLALDDDWVRKQRGYAAGAIRFRLPVCVTLAREALSRKRRREAEALKPPDAPPGPEERPCTPEQRKEFNEEIRRKFPLLMRAPALPTRAAPAAPIHSDLTPEEVERRKNEALKALGQIP